jgi:hypothetical protein
MNDAFEAASQAYEESLKAKDSSPESNTQSSEEIKVESTDNTQSSVDAKAEAQAQIAELEKIGTFKYQGKTWSVGELEKAMLRQQDYTKKTQSVAEERKAIEEDRKYYDNLYYDLEKVKANPSLANEFVSLYPEKFHSYLESVLANTNTQMPQQAETRQTPTYAQPDIKLLSRLDRLEKTYQQQEVEKTTQEIQKTMDGLSKKYPDALPEVCLARAYEAHNAKVKMTPEVWEDIYKTSDKQMKDWAKARYGELVNKQKTANEKARDVDPGGGTLGRAPKVFKKFDDITNNMIESLKGSKH